MKNKIFLKISAIIFSIIVLYAFFITFIVTAKISQYLENSEIKQAKTQLKRVDAIIKSKEEYLKIYQANKQIEYKNKLKDISNIVYEIILGYFNLYQNGILSKEQARQKSFETISKLKFGQKNDYIYILNTKGEVFFHPQKEYLATNAYDLKDKNGNLFIKELIENTKKQNEFFFNYTWSEKKDVNLKKMAYSLYFEPFDLVIISSLATNDLTNELYAEKKKITVELKPLIKSITKEDLGYIFILDDKGNLVLHPEDRFFRQENLANTKVLFENLKKAYKEGKPFRYKWNTKEDFKNFNYDKIAWISHNEFFGWYINSSFYIKDLEEKSRQINSLIIGSSLSFIIIIALFAIYYLKKLLNPIRVLTQNAILVKNGNLKIRNKIVSKDELGILAEQFNTMLDVIENNTKDLEQKVKERTAQLEYKLYRDELTKLQNRFSLIKELKKHEFSALSIVSIDDFDNVNEFYGLEAGDEVLIESAKRLKDFAQKEDLFLFRTGSNNFALLDTHLERFLAYDKVIKKIQEVFKKEIKIKSLGLKIVFDITIGTSISQDEQLANANVALKNAKNKGEKFTVYNQTIDTKSNIENIAYWKEQIKYALKNDKVIPFFQPIFNRNNQIIKYEVLMRIEQKQKEEKQYLSPVKFLPVAIKIKQYFALNKRVIQKAFALLDEIDKSISINLSFSDIMNIEFVHFIKEEIDKLSKKNRKKIVFEILESDKITDYEILNEFIQEYRKKEIKIAIDDFGTGFSNFSYILKIKPDYIKIDGSLIKEINTDANSYELVKSIITFCKALNIKVIAEYIHSKEVYEIVKDLGVDEFQGYYLGEPKPLK